MPDDGFFLAPTACVEAPKRTCPSCETPLDDDAFTCPKCSAVAPVPSGAVGMHASAGGAHSGAPRWVALGIVVGALTAGAVLVGRDRHDDTSARQARDGITSSLPTPVDAQ